MIRAADHPQIAQLACVARGDDGVDDWLGAERGRIRVDRFAANRDAAPRRHIVTGPADCRQHRITTCRIDVADVDLESRPARHAVDRSWKQLAHPARGDRIVRSRRARRRFDRECNLRRREERVMAIQHEHRACVSAFTLDENPQARRGGDGRDDPDVQFQPFEDGSLLYVQLDERRVGAGLQRHVSQGA